MSTTDVDTKLTIGTNIIIVTIVAGSRRSSSFSSSRGSSIIDSYVV